MKVDQKSPAQLEKLLKAARHRNDRLERSLERYRNLAKMTPEILFESDLSGNLTFLNKRGMEIFGITKEDIERGFNYFQFILPDDRVRAKANIQKLASKENLSRQEYTAVDKEGKKFPIISFSSIITKNGKAKGIRGIIVDVTPLKAAEEKLRKTVLHYENLIGNISEVLWSSDLKLRLDYVSPSVERLFGYTPEEMIEQSVSTLTPESLEKIKNIYKELLPEQLEKPDEIIKTRLDLQQIKKDGTPIWVEIEPSFIIDDDNNPVGVIGVSRDITQRKKVEEELAKYRNHLEDLVRERTKQLEQSEAKYRLLADRVTDIIWTTDLEFNLTYVSPSVFNRTGFTQEEFCSSSLEQRLTKESINLAAKTLRASLESLEENSDAGMPVATLELEQIKKDGSIIPIEIRASFLVDKDNHPIGIVGISRDITDRKKAEKELESSEAKYRSLITNIPDVVWTLDADCNTTFISPNVKRITGYDHEEVYGQTDQFWKNIIHPDDFGRVKQAFKELFEKNKQYDVKYRIRKKDGDWIWIHERAIDTYQMDGKSYADGLFSDITLHKLNQEELRLSESKFSSVFHSSPSGIGISSFEDGRCVDINESFSRITGLNRETAIGKFTPELGFWVDAEDREKLKRRLMENERCHDFEIDFKDQSGNLKKGIISADIMKIGNEKHIITILDDVTEQKAMEEKNLEMEKQLLQAQKMEAIGTLAGGIAHDVNNVLQTIVNNAYLGKEELPKDHPIQTELYGILKSSRRAKDLIDQILTFSRSADHEKRYISLYPMINETLKMLRSTLPKNIEIQQRIFDQSGFVFADPTQIHQVMMNLCTNAAHAMRDKGGTLEVVLRQCTLDEENHKYANVLDPGIYVRLSIMDTGKGMNSATLSRIFEPFFTTKQLGEGTGLGMSMVHGIITSMKGKIFIESEPEKGTLIDIFLPRSEHGEKKHKSDIPAMTRGEGTILYVDDEEDQLRIVKKLLEKRGYKVDTSLDGRDALVILEKFPEKYDIILLDQVMPGMDGFEIADAIRKINPDIPMLLVTGNATTEVERKVITSPIENILKKPFTPEELSGAIKEHLKDRINGENE